MTVTGQAQRPTGLPCRRTKNIYVTAGGQRTMRYEIRPDDTVANGQLFVEHGSDGMRVDRVVFGSKVVPISALHFLQGSDRPAFHSFRYFL